MFTANVQTQRYLFFSNAMCFFHSPYRTHANAGWKWVKRLKFWKNSLHRYWTHQQHSQRHPPAFDFVNCCKAFPSCRNTAVLFHIESKTPFCNLHSIEGKSRPYKMKATKEKQVVSSEQESWIRTVCDQLQYFSLTKFQQVHYYFLFLFTIACQKKIQNKHPCVKPKWSGKLFLTML